MRIKGVPVGQTGIEHWTLRQDRGLSYAAQRPEHTELVAGSWWPADYAGPPLVSIEDEVAEAYRVGIGDSLSFNVLGRVIEAKIASLRPEIDWSQGRLDFVFLFSPGVLEAAPHTLPPRSRCPRPRRRRSWIRWRRLPNVTPITIREVVERVGEVLANIRIAIGVVGGVTLLSGILVLAGAVAAARRRHLYEAVMLKVLGARLGSFAHLCDRVSRPRRHGGARRGLVGTLGAAVIVVGFMGLEWTFAPLVVAVVLLIALLITLVAGFVEDLAPARALCGRGLAGALIASQPATARHTWYWAARLSLWLSFR